MCVGHLKALIRILFTASDKSMSTSFGLLSLHLRVSFTHASVWVRRLALEILTLLFDAFPILARKDCELYESFLSLMRSAKKPNVKNLLREVVKKFRLVYEGPEPDESSSTTQLPPSNGWTAKELDNFASRFHFPAFYGSKSVARKTTDTTWLEQFV